MTKQDIAQEFMDMFNDTYGTEIDNFSDLFDTLVQKFPDRPDKKFLMHVHDIPVDKIRLGLLDDGSKDHILTIAEMKNDTDVSRVLFSILVHDPKNLRNVAKILNKYADQIETEVRN